MPTGARTEMLGNGVCSLRGTRTDIFDDGLPERSREMLTEMVTACVEDLKAEDSVALH